MTKRICLVTGEMLGVVRNGGLGTATTYLAVALAREGHDVELLHFGPDEVVDAIWSERYATAGIRITQLPPPPRPVVPAFHATSHRVYTYLREHDYDTIVFQDWQAPGFATIRSKQVGLGFAATTLVVYCHGPTRWLNEANRRALVSVDLLMLDVMERAAVETADVVVSPSRHLMSWMAGSGWQLPVRSYVIPLFSRSTAGDPVETVGAVGQRVDELIFFGRLEDRKGIEVFIKAVNRLEPALMRGRKLTFLGRQDTWSARRIERELAPETRAEVTDLRFLTSLDSEEALSVVSRPGALAVMPSLDDNSPCVIYECIERGIPFLTSSRGGGPELIRAEDHARSVVEPSERALTDALARVLVEGPPAPVGSSFERADLIGGWSGAIAASEPRNSTQTEPHVSVVVTHYERPELLELCLEGLRQQTYAPIDVAVVDDGSVSSAACTYLAELEERVWPWPLRVVRQENRYVGAARNAGWRTAPGPLVAFLDDDDVPGPEFVRVLVRAREASGADVVTCGFQMVYQATGLPHVRAHDQIWLFAGEPRVAGTFMNQYGGSSALWPTWLLEQLGGFHERHGVTHEDWDLFARASLAGATIVSVPEPLLMYRVAPGSMFRTRLEYECDRVITDTFAAAMPERLRDLPALVYEAYAADGRRAEGLMGRLKDNANLAGTLARRSVEVARSDGMGEVLRRGRAYVRARRGASPGA